MALTPRQLQENLNTISDELYERCQEMAGIASRKGIAWLNLRRNCKTNGECDKEWDITADGQRENYLKWYIRGLQAKRGALLQEAKANSNTW